MNGHPLRARAAVMLAAAPALAIALSGCENATNEDSREATVQRVPDSTGAVVLRRGPAAPAPQTRDADADAASGAPAPGGEDAAPAAGSSADPRADDRRALGTFSTAAAAVDAEGDDFGRLPAPGDLAIYIPATTLFPGSARLDPGVVNPYSGDEQAIAAGERHFNAFNCSGCHAPMGGGGMGPPLTDGKWIHGGEPAQIFMSIMHGRPNGMPAWSSMLPRRTVWEIVAYIETLDTVDNYASALGFDAEHALSPRLTGRHGDAAEARQ